MDLIKKLEKEIEQYFVGENTCHSLEHTKRVLKNAVFLAKQENADIEIVTIAALLHDIGREKESLFPELCHAEEGAKLAKQILLKYEYDQKKINEVVHCIETHRFRKKNNPPITIEAKCLFDADKLDSIGAIGVGRAFMWVGKIDAKLHNEKGTKFVSGQELGPEDTAFREFSIKLRFLKDLMFTRAGKKLAEQRHDFMEAFFEQLDKELNEID